MANGANDFTAEELDRLFSDDFEQETPPVDDATNGEQTDDIESGNDNDDIVNKPTNSIDQTKAFAKRLKESTEKVRLEEREAIAKSLGYDSYDDLQKRKENKILEDNGLDPEQVSPAIDKLVQERIESDPRMKELESYRQERVKEFGKRELEEIKKLTNGEITSLAQLPKEVIDLWKQKGSLKSAYLELEGEKLITKIRGEQSKGSTGHLANLAGSTPSDTMKRLLTVEEKRAWKVFYPNMTEKELNEMTVDIK